MRISDWSSDVCSSDLIETKKPARARAGGNESDGTPQPHAAIVDPLLMGGPHGNGFDQRRDRWPDGHQDERGTADLPKAIRKKAKTKDRKSVVKGKRRSELGDSGGRRLNKKKKK